MIKPWGKAEREEWRSRQSLKRSYAVDVVANIDRLRSRFDVVQYGELDYAPDRYSLFAIKSRDARDDLPVVLVMAGSYGTVGRLPDVVRTLGRLPGPVQSVVVAGRDAALVARLRRLGAGTPTRVLGYVDDVRALMAAADLLVTKAGGMTLAEAMAAELPMLLYGSLPGQERRNERFASRAGVALAARSRRELGRLLERALTEPGLLEHLRDCIRRARRPDATHRIVDAVLAPGPLLS